MKLKWIVAILVTVTILFGQVGLSTHVYADPSKRPYELPISTKPPEIAGVVEVSTLEQLQYISWYEELYRDKKIKLMNSINMYNTPWIPIQYFSGTFDGNNYDISNLIIYQSVNDSYNYWGMFLLNNGIIKNMTLTNFTVTGKATVMGTLAGFNGGEIKNVGIIGGKIDQIIPNGATGVVDVGGLIGRNGGAIDNVYSTCKVSVFKTSIINNNIGGIAGTSFNTLKNAYSTGALAGEASFKYGLSAGYTVLQSYYDQETTGIGVGSLSTHDMLIQSSFAEWDFQNTWSILPGKTYPFLKGMRSVTPEVILPAIQNTNYSQKLQIPRSFSAPDDLIWEAISLPPGLSLSNDGTLSGTPTSFGDQSFTVVVYSPSTHIVYGSGTISLLINPDPKSISPDVNNIDIVNNLTPTTDTVTVKALNAGDVIKVYDSPTGGNLLSSATVPFGQTSVTASVYQLGTTAGQVYVSTTSTGKTESTRTAKAYEAEPIVDTIAPTTKYHFDPIYGTSSSGIRYIKGYTTTLRATDNVSGSGVKSTQYRINGGTWIEYTSPFTFYAGVTHIVEYFSTDNAGNIENPMNVMDFDKGKFTGAGKF
jgi:hypothetical protein